MCEMSIIYQKTRYSSHKMEMFMNLTFCRPELGHFGCQKFPHTLKVPIGRSSQSANLFGTNYS